MIIIVAYDISDDDRRAHLAALLQSCGDRIQRSVFVLTITDDDLAELRHRIRSTTDPRTDSVYFIQQCSTCWSGLVCEGQAEHPTPALYWAAL